MSIRKLESIGKELREYLPELLRQFPEIEGKNNKELVSYFYDVRINRNLTGPANSSVQTIVETIDIFGLQARFKDAIVFKTIRIS